MDERNRDIRRTVRENKRGRKKREAGKGRISKRKGWKEEKKEKGKSCRREEAAGKEWGGGGMSGLQEQSRVEPLARGTSARLGSGGSNLINSTLPYK